MGLLFFNDKREIGDVSKYLNENFGLTQPCERDSLNVYKGIYYVTKVLGLSIKLEYNSYDYENEYKYMLGVDCDFLSDEILSEEEIEVFTQVVAKNVSYIIGNKVAYEDGEELKLIEIENNNSGSVI